MTIKAVKDFVASLEAEGCTVTPIETPIDIDPGGFTVADVIKYLQQLPQSWPVKVKTKDLCEDISIWRTVNGWEAGGGEVLLTAEYDD